jgi:riboflavin kinase / FMN adenylyltransferase
MRVARSVEEAARFGPSAVTIGNFDGVHAGHRRLFQQVIDAARKSGLHSSVLTFDPHPATIVAPARAPRLLTTPEERARLMGAQGIEQVLILPFTAELARLSPEEFVQQILVKTMCARIVLVGDNFRFGHKQAGDTRVLEKLGGTCGFETRIVDAVKCRGRVVSSSEVRGAIARGQVSLAWRLLERPYALEGEVVPGHGIGSKQTVPTLNLQPSGAMLPANGVYITRTHDLDDGRSWRSITNVGLRPTFGGDSLTVETFLLDPLGDPSPRHIRVELLHHVREEKKFENAEALKAQILRDVGRANVFFRRFTDRR